MTVICVRVVEHETVSYFVVARQWTEQRRTRDLRFGSLTQVLGDNLERVDRDRVVKAAIAFVVNAKR